MHSKLAFVTFYLWNKLYFTIYQKFIRGVRQAPLLKIKNSRETCDLISDIFWNNVNLDGTCTLYKYEVDIKRQILWNIRNPYSHVST